MVDLTKNDKEKENYIVDLQIVEDTKQISFTLAGGEKSFIPFSVHNYMAYLQRMEKQYFTFGPIL